MGLGNAPQGDQAGSGMEGVGLSVPPCQVGSPLLLSIRCGGGSPGGMTVGIDQRNWHHVA